MSSDIEKLSRLAPTANRTDERGLCQSPTNCKHNDIAPPYALRKENLPSYPLIDEHALARRISVSIHTVRQWRVQGRGPEYVKIGRCVRYKESAVEEFLAQNTVRSTSHEKSIKKVTPDSGIEEADNQFSENSCTGKRGSL